jgi:glycosyltransferase involved in cell wall biosynthesis
LLRTKIILKVTFKMFFSIITPTYNSEKKIQKHIESLNNQNSSFEQIIVDNCSIDKTIDFVKKYSKHDLKIFIENDSGIYEAMNKGIKNSIGKYLIFLNSDDWLYENILEEVKDFIIKKEYPDVIYSNAFFYKDKKFLFKKKAKIDNLLKKMSLFHPSIFFKRELFDNFLYDKKFKVAADYDLILKLYKNPFIRMVYLDKYTSNISLGGFSSDLELSSSDFWKIQIKNNNLKKSIINFLLFYKFKLFTLLCKKIKKKICSQLQY